MAIREPSVTGRRGETMRGADLTAMDQSTEAGETHQSLRKRRIRRYFRRSAALICLVGSLVFSGLLLKPFYSQNLGIVDHGRVIRTAQPTSSLKDLIQDYKLASILNLRGGSPRDSWYAHEARTAEESGVSFYDFPMSATRRPKRFELLRLIDLLKRCEYPLLIHCKAGADRTGLATTVYNMVALGQPPETAKEAFTIFHSHFPFFGTQHLHAPIDEYAAWLTQNNLPHTADRFREWVKNDYRADDPSVDPPPLAAGPRHPL